MFLPKSKYSVRVVGPGQYTRNGETYYGPVLTTYTGENYAGSDPSNLNGKLEPVVKTETTVNYVSPGKKRVPTEEEYLQGSMTRYFMQDTVTNKIFELLPEDWNGRDTDTRYRYASTRWIIKGNLADTYINGYRYKGVGERNREYMLNAEKQLPGIISSGVLSDPSQFVID